MSPTPSDAQFAAAAVKLHTRLRKHAQLAAVLAAKELVRTECGQISQSGSRVRLVVVPEKFRAPFQKRAAGVTGTDRSNHRRAGRRTNDIHTSCGRRRVTSHR